MSNFVYGFHSVNPLVWQAPESVELIYLDQKRQDKRCQELINAAKDHQVKVELTSAAKLDKLCASSKHQGVVAVLKATITAKVHTLKDLMERLADQDKAIIVVLDGVTDPHNLGAIIRTCDCFGVAAVIIPKNNSASINATVAKVASGAINHLPVVVVNNLAHTLDEIKKSGFWIAGTSLTDDSVSLFDFKPDKKMVWVMGSEGDGIRRLVAENCDYLVSIPMFGHTQSLNVSVAAGVVLSFTAAALARPQ